MAKWWLVVAAIAGLAVGLAAGALWLGADRTAVVDVERLFKESDLAAEYNEKLQQEQETRQRELEKITDARKRAEQAEKQKQELINLQQQYREEFLERLDEVLAALAKRNRVGTVFVRGTVVRHAQVDLTEAAMKELSR